LQRYFVLLTFARNLIVDYKKAEIMGLNLNKNLKMYYSIKEVAKMFDVNESLLRYWETEFPLLKPKTSANNVRQYTEKDIEEIKLIYNLVKIRGFKIAAARKILNENHSGADKKAEVIDRLVGVRDELVELKKQLDSIV
jgi:DNA-binding transcriptional MerR regulator